MANPILWFWREIRGNAFWDAAKFLWGTVGAGMTSAIHASISWWKGHPDNITLLIGSIPAVILGIGWIVSLIRQTAPAAAHNVESDDLETLRALTKRQAEELERYHEAEHNQASTHARQAEALRTAPQLRISYSRDDTQDFLHFENDSGPQAMAIQVGPVYWHETRSIQLDDDVPTLAEKQKDVRRFFFYASNGILSIEPLNAFLRKMVGSDLRITVQYSTKSATYGREFQLRAAADGSVLCNPLNIMIRQLHVQPD